uniref:Succinate dehydrogenase assembly factor 3 n=1 Tax=Timema douglasi TaxID=61478 RepID=A0A7R8V923_TIMDO|nr:unnamed protein product [Timema douglasi]
MELSHVQRVRLLYKTVLRLHRGLPDELKQLGNIYVREEFKRHKLCNIAEAAAFMNEWTRYAVTIAQQLGIRGPKYSEKLGQNLEESFLHEMRDDQVQQLFDLLVAATGVDPNDQLTKTI